MSSVFFGEDDSRSLRQVVRCILVYSLVCVGILTLPVFLFATPLVRLFLSQPGLQCDLTVRALRIYSFFLPLAALSDGLFGYIQGTGNRRLAQFFTASAEVGLTVAMYVLTSFLGTDGLWLSYSLGSVIGGAFCFAVILLRQRHENASFSDKLMLISASALEAEQNSVYTDVKQLPDAPAVSERIHRFCLEKGIDSKRAYKAALCAEEMVKNVLQYGFRPGKENLCSVRLIIRGKDVILRIRDNCEGFNTKEYFQNHEKTGDIVSGIGIRLVCSLAKDVQYVQLVKTNTLSIMI